MPVKEEWRRLLAEIQAAGTARGRARLGLCSLEGTRLFERALRAGARIEGCLVTEAFLSDPDPRLVALRADLAAHGCTLRPVPSSVMRELTEGRSIGDVVGLARLPGTPTLSAVLERAAAPPALLLCCVQVDDPGNVGALVRTAHASGAAALVSVGTTDAFHPRAVRTSMGSVFRLPVIERSSLSELVAELRAAGVRTLAAVSRAGTPVHERRPAAGPLALLLGSEAFGLDDGARGLVDECVTVPMPPGVDSFSVNAAAAVLLYELGRPRPPLAGSAITPRGPA